MRTLVLVLLWLTVVVACSWTLETRLRPEPTTDTPCPQGP